MNRSKLLVPIGITLLVALVIFGYSLLLVNKIVTNSDLNHLDTSEPSRPVPSFDHIAIIVMENHGTYSIIGNKSAPYLNKLASTNALATNYSAIFHPSLPNYLALTSGTNAGITTDCSPSSICQANVKNIADEIESTGRTWKAYQEDMPRPCADTNAGLYAVRHDPFAYYPDITRNVARCQKHVVAYSQLASDLSKNQLPSYSFITPNVCHDMHNCSVKIGDDWLKNNVPKLLNSSEFTKQNSLLIITFDEAEASDSGNKVAAILIGKSVVKHYKSNATYSHYGLLHTIESAWGLTPMTENDIRAPIMKDFFK